tara:strand:- start:1256 stop:1420 length:165 start_codon:yes stop_codon:yes gene_type:complete
MQLLANYRQIVLESIIEEGVQYDPSSDYETWLLRILLSTLVLLTWWSMMENSSE